MYNFNHSQNITIIILRILPPSPHLCSFSFLIPTMTLICNRSKVAQIVLAGFLLWSYDAIVTNPKSSVNSQMTLWSFEIQLSRTIPFNFETLVQFWSSMQLCWREIWFWLSKMAACSHYTMRFCLMFIDNYIQEVPLCPNPHQKVWRTGCVWR